MPAVPLALGRRPFQGPDMLRFSKRLGILAAALFSATAAMASTEVVIKNDQAKMLVLSGKPGTVVVGNPSIVDVTVQGSNVFVHGRNFGTTNVLVYDRDGQELGNLEVTVMKGGSNNVSVFRAASRYTYACSPKCESAPDAGDNFDWFKNMTDEAKTKGEMAIGASKAGD